MLISVITTSNIGIICQMPLFCEGTVNDNTIETAEITEILILTIQASE